MKRILLLLAALTWISWPAIAKEPEPNGHSADEAAIRKLAETYCAAFDRRDAKTLAEQWSPDAIYTSPISGKQVRGRAAIEAEFAGMFQAEGEARLTVKIESIRFITSDVAIEDGTASVMRPGEAPSESTYTVVHVKKDGRWFIDSDRETVRSAPPTAYEQLKDLEWMVGTWTDNDDSATVKTVCQWTAGRAFLTRTFSIAIKDQVELQGTQVIGWDPVKKQIRSWAFDSDGGFAEGTWNRDGDRWLIHSVNTLPDGRKGVSSNVMRRIDNDHFGWSSVGREVNGELLPGIDEVEVVRQ
jgi:uncharacterized protein (TIGR02246 family)